MGFMEYLIKSSWQGTANAITHNSAEDKDSITVVWTPPSAMSGEVVFQVIFLQNIQQ